FGDLLHDFLLRADAHIRIPCLRVLILAAADHHLAGRARAAGARDAADDSRRRRDFLRRVPGGAGLMASFLHVLKTNRNYRYTWMGQVVSEIGDHFNNIAVFSLVLANTHSGLAVSGVMLSRAVPAVLAGPIAGVLLDRLDRKKVMIASDVIRAVVALGFILTVD